MKQTLVSELMREVTNPIHLAKNSFARDLYYSLPTQRHACPLETLISPSHQELQGIDDPHSNY